MRYCPVNHDYIGNCKPCEMCPDDINQNFMTLLKDIAKLEEEQQPDPVYDCLNAIKNWPESSKCKLLFYFVGTIKELKIKLKI